MYFVHAFSSLHPAVSECCNNSQHLFARLAKNCFEELKLISLIQRKVCFFLFEDFNSILKVRF